MVNHPAEYKWSSYAANAQGEENLIIQPHVLYNALGLDEVSRQVAYRELFRYELDIGVVDEIRKAINGNYVLGSFDILPGINAGDSYCTQAWH